MKKIVIVLIILSISIAFYAQEKVQQPDSKIFEGAWIGTVGDKSYEFELEKDTLYMKEFNVYLNILRGSIKYLEKGKIVRILPINAEKSPLVGIAFSESLVELSYEDTEKGLKGKVKLNMDLSDKNTLKWKLGTREGFYSSSEIKFDLPKEMTLKRK